MKKLLLVLLSLVMGFTCIGMIGCGATNDDEEEEVVETLAGVYEFYSIREGDTEYKVGDVFNGVEITADEFESFELCADGTCKLEGVLQEGITWQEQNSTVVIYIDGEMETTYQVSGKLLISENMGNGFRVVYKKASASIPGDNTGDNTGDNNDNTTPEEQLISGAVFNAESNMPIAGATIDIFADIDMTILVTSVTSNANGGYETLLPVGIYYIKITAMGFISFETIQAMAEGGTTYVESFIMVEGEDGTDVLGTIGGSIVNSVTGAIVSGVSIEVREGWNNSDGEILYSFSSDSNGYYEISIPLGNYTVTVKKDGFITNSINVVVSGTINLNFQANIVPDSTDTETQVGDLRIVLTWGATPSDLDSHLVGPTLNDSGYFHTYYSNKNYYYNNELSAFLDLDDTSSYGPETTTVYAMADSGIYSFYVHDYTTYTGTDSTVMASSGAKVEVYRGETIIQVFHVPTNKTGTLWHVFNYDASTGRIIPVNEFSGEVDSTSSIGSRS